MSRVRHAAAIGPIALLIATATLPAPASIHPGSLIIPSKSIGPFHLGMTPLEFQVVRRTAPCDVLALFDEGRANRLETNCGGAYRTTDYIMVGLDPTRMLAIFGTPDRVSGSDFNNTRAEWLHYARAGIAFRLVYGDPGSALIQAIAVFQGTGPLDVRRPRPLPTPPTAPPPGVGE